MGNVGFTPIQKAIVTEFAKTDNAKNFYFTGGTALSVMYLHHRKSEDLDFFTEHQFDNEPIQAFVAALALKLKATYRFTQHHEVRIFEFVRGAKLLVKVDFGYYPYHRVEISDNKRDNLAIDSLRDIAANKLLTINQRTDVKDFVDLYFLLKEFTLWDLLRAVEVKFGMELDRVMIASDFLKVEQFDYLPRMLVPLTNKELIKFFRAQSRELAKRITKN